MQATINLDDDFINGIQRIAKYKRKHQDIILDALTLLNWAVAEAAAGRVVLSANSEGEQIHRLSMDVFKRIEANRKG
jgi:predicted transcriptional regulator